MRISLIAASVLLAGCVSGKVIQIPATDFKSYGVDPLSHTMYLGSDDGWHYFAWSSGKTGGKWKVLKSEMPFNKEWSVEEGRPAFVARDDHGHWQPLGGR